MAHTQVHHRIYFQCSTIFWLRQCLKRHSSHQGHQDASRHMTGLHTCTAGICCEEFWGQLLEGQNFMCITTRPAALNDVATLLQLPTLFLYEWLLPPWSIPTYPTMAKLVSGGKVDTHNTVLTLLFFAIVCCSCSLHDCTCTCCCTFAGVCLQSFQVWTHRLASL
jgi:hypothetical protein